MVIKADGPEIQVTINGEMIVNTSLIRHMELVDDRLGWPLLHMARIADATLYLLTGENLMERPFLKVAEGWVYFKSSAIE